MLHDAQLMTALDCVSNMLREPNRSGLVLGAMQSGKTTTSLALQFAGPIVYLLTGRKTYPIYLVTSHTSQEDQTKIELQNFLDYYGDLEIVVDKENRCSLIEYVGELPLHPAFLLSPTIATYRAQVLRDALPSVYIGPRLEDFVQRRVRGDGVQRVAALCRRANEADFSPLLIIDEPQFGASDRLVQNDDGEFERRPCVLVRMFEAIEAALGTERQDHVFIGLSATPYELKDLSKVWTVKQYLTPAYSGFNYFGGEVISDGVDVTPPRTMGFGEFAREARLPFLANVSLSAYQGPREFTHFARKVGFSGGHQDYQRQVEATLRQAIRWMIGRSREPVGICVRLLNDNTGTRHLLDQLGLGPHELEVIKYFGPEFKGKSVKRVIEERRRPELPYLIAVTNRARMGDAFPGEVQWFLDFSRRAADLNALLQGLLGRACGYGKKSNVILSDENAEIIADYRRTQGGYIYRTSRHSFVVNGYRRGAPTSLLRVRSDMKDPLIREFFRRVNEEVVEPVVLQDRTSLSTHRTIGGRHPYRTGPILRIANELGLFEHLESEASRKRLFPTIPARFRIARATDRVRHGRKRERFLEYTVDEKGDCRFTFRWTTEDASHSGLSSRGYGARDASDRARAGDHLEPQVNMEKFDPRTGRLINDKSSEPAARQRGNWRAFMVTLPLVEPVRELEPGDTTFPIETSPYSELMTVEEREVAGFGE
ncbi:hypothetical protein [Corallococcus sp. 4LFB]|uniref:hypothetical protein n=1 Tax=Corallococcus sp. 4LFB TaxID=3383249 RepID=UPI0039756C08